MCIFCSIISNKIPSYKLYEDDLCLVILDISQVTQGHCLVLPKQHVETLLDVDEKTLAHLASITKKYASIIRNKTGCSGFNILNNNFESAGQTIAHLHYHIIPRYTANDNFKIEFIEHNSINIDRIYRLLTE